MRLHVASLLVSTSLFWAPAALAIDAGVVGPNLKIRPADSPTTLPSAKLSAAKNEIEPFQIVLTSAAGSTSGVSVKVGKTLTSASGATIADSNITLFRADYYDVGVPSNSEGA